MMNHQFFFSPHILDNLNAPQVGFLVVQDISEPRLRMYITARGIKSFFVRKRVNGRDCRIIIGQYPETTIEQARSRVNDILTTPAKKIPTRRNKISFKKITEMYISARVKRGEDSRAKLIRSIKLHLSPLFDLNIQDISVRDIDATLDKILGTSVRNRMRELLLSIFKYSIDQGYSKENPVIQIKKLPEIRRKRPLDADGLCRLVRAIRKEQSTFIQAAFLLLVYGFAPKSRIFSMRWADLDFNEDSWGHAPLSDMAIVVLRDLPQSGRWVFPGKIKGRHLTDPRAAWKRVCGRAKLPDLRMDDVHKFMMRHLEWAGDRRALRQNMNDLLDSLQTL